MRVKLLVLLAAVVLALSMTSAGFGAWGGQVDGDQHPFVGAMYADFNGDDEITWDELVCSGSNAGPAKNGGSDVFLTAAHCVAWAPTAGIDTFWVSFDADPQEGDGIPEGLIEASSFHWDPRFGHDAGNYYDVAVLLLPAGSFGSLPRVTLPPAGYLDGLKARGELKGMVIELVGYGVVPTWHQPGGTQFAFDGLRRTSFSQVIGLSQAWLRFLQNANATGLGGACFGDSGSPQLVPGTRMVVSVTSGGNGNCNANNYNYRLDTPGAREFLGEYLTLP
jgi:hypothetical protein